MFNREIKVAQLPIFTGRKFFIMAGFLYLAFMSYAVHSARAQEAQGVQYDENGWRRIQLEDGTWAREKVTYFLPNHLGGTDVEVDEHGTIVARADYLPYGEDRVRLETEASDSHQFTGQEKDGETGLYYYGARYYDPLVGRFLSVDPLVLDEAVKTEKDLIDILKYPQMLNGYTYTNNNPVNYVDSSGEIWQVAIRYVLPAIFITLSQKYPSYAPDNDLVQRIEAGNAPYQSDKPDLISVSLQSTQKMKPIVKINNFVHSSSTYLQHYEDLRQSGANHLNALKLAGTLRWSSVNRPQTTDLDFNSILNQAYGYNVGNGSLADKIRVESALSGDSEYTEKGNVILNQLDTLIVDGDNLNATNKGNAYAVYDDLKSALENNQ